MKYNIVRNTERYGDIPTFKDYPDKITCEGTLRQARMLAEDIYIPGCDGCYYVEGDDE